MWWGRGPTGEWGGGRMGGKLEPSQCHVHPGARHPSFPRLKSEYERLEGFKSFYKSFQYTKSKMTHTHYCALKARKQRRACNIHHNPFSYSPGGQIYPYMSVRTARRPWDAETRASLDFSVRSARQAHNDDAGRLYVMLTDMSTFMTNFSLAGTVFAEI